MSFLSSRFGKVAAGTVVAGALAFGGAGAANADDTVPVETIEFSIPTEGGSVGGGESDWTPPPAPGPGDDVPSVEMPVEEAPVEETPETPATPEPTAPPAEDDGCEKHDGKHDHEHGNKHSEKFEKSENKKHANERAAHWE
jgi:hypothetical protein